MLQQNIRIKKVRELTGLGISTIWLWARKGNHNFPKPFKIGKCTFWRMSDVQKWMAERYQESEAVNETH